MKLQNEQVFAEAKEEMESRELEELAKAESMANWGKKKRLAYAQHMVDGDNHKEAFAKVQNYRKTEVTGE